MGRHFLTDTLFAAVFMAIVAAVLYHALGVGGVPNSLTLTNLRHDLRLVLDAVRRRGRRRPRAER